MTDLARALIAKFSAPTTADPSRAEASPQLGSTVDRLSRHDIHVRLAALIGDVQSRPPTEMARALNELTVTAVQYAPGAQYAGITVTDGRGHIDTASAIGRYPGLLDAIQECHHQGPCLQAVRQHDTVRVDDLNTEIRWPKYQRDALAQTPIRSVLSYPLSANHQDLGALNFYAEHPHAFDTESERLGFVYATHAALAWNHFAATSSSATPWPHKTSSAKPRACLWSATKSTPRKLSTGCVSSPRNPTHRSLKSPARSPPTLKRH
jgi:transcriptional regulator with GAF, ATPase, and Fis domain